MSLSDNDKIDAAPLITGGDLPPLLPNWTMFDGARREALGHIPSFFSEDDSRPATAQIAANYDWTPLDGCTIADHGDLLYPGDAPLKPLAETRLRDETIRVYPDAWVAIIQPDGSLEVDRVD